jgi:hypothetical protein
MLKRIAALAVAAAALIVGTGLFATPAHAETAGQYGVPRTGRICVEDNGWNFFNPVLPELASRMRAQGVSNIVVWDECDGPGGQKNVYHKLDHVIDIVTANEPNSNWCARVERTWAWNGSKWVVSSTNIRINIGIAICWSSTFNKAHVISHEMMHAYGAVHEGRDDRVVDAQGGWTYQWPTNQDYRELRYFGYTDLH